MAEDFDNHRRIFDRGKLLEREGKPDYVFSAVMPYTIVPLHFSARRARRGSATNPTRHAAFGSVVCQDARSLSEN